jgi:hypothetical protein
MQHVLKDLSARSTCGNDNQLIHGAYQFDRMSESRTAIPAIVTLTRLAQLDAFPAGTM